MHPMKKPMKTFLMTIKLEPEAIDFGKMRFLRKSSILQYLKTYTDLRGIPVTLNGHMMETDEPVCVLIC